VKEIIDILYKIHIYKFKYGKYINKIFIIWKKIYIYKFKYGKYLNKIFKH